MAAPILPRLASGIRRLFRRLVLIFIVEERQGLFSGISVGDVAVLLSGKFFRKR